MEKSQHNKLKIVVIGLDGATWDIINSMNRRNELPNISRLMEHGSYGICEAPPPLISPVLWTSISTGKLPDKHGIKDFWATAKTRRCKTIWDILEQQGVAIGVFGHFTTWPPKKVNGFVVPNLFTARGTETYPPELGFLSQLEVKTREGKKTPLSHYLRYALLCRQFGVSVRTLSLGARLLIGKLSRLSDERKDFFWQRVFRQEMQSDVFVYLSKRYQPGYSFFHMHLLDACSHYFWKYREPELFDGLLQREIKKYKNVISEAYKKADATIGKILREMDDRSIVLVVSDHGFCAVGKEFKYRKRIKFEPLLKVLGIENEARGINLGAKAVIRILDSANEQKIMDLLKNVTVKETAEKLFQVEKEGHDNISLRFNPAVEESTFEQDMHMRCSGTARKLQEFIARNPDRLTGTHHPSGMFILSGPNIKKGLSAPAIRNIDLVPTLLTLVGVPVGQDMDGQVITGIIEEQFLNESPPTYIPTYDGEPYGQHLDAEEGEDSDLLREQLKSLGYL